jgi:hypothetical protein
MHMAREQITMVPVQLETLTNEQRDAWDYYLEAKQALNTALNVNAPAGKKIVFTGKYNVLKIAMVSKAQPKAQTKAVSLGEWLNAQVDGGHNV